MKLISHRGNVYRRIAEAENHPDYIKGAIISGFEVEIDAWVNNASIYLGHDKPQYPVDLNWLEQYSPYLWIHCKNLEALSYFTKIKSDLNYFSHDQDFATLTSKGYIWSTKSCDQGILVLPENYNTTLHTGTIGICSDEIEKWRQHS
jgi:hypothetical protein